MGFIYSWGASVVLIGALFKLQHWPYYGLLLGIGLITKAVIFFVSAFEPPLETPEWSKVYPELREDYEGGDLQEIDKPQTSFTDLLGGTEITPALLDKVKYSLDELSNTAKGISDISSATLATEMYVRNLSSASDAMTTFSDVNTRAHNSIHQSVSQMVEAYSSTSRQMSAAGQTIIEKMNRTGDDFVNRISESGSLLSKTYKSASEKIEQNMQHFGDSSGNYAENLSKLNKNLAALNNAVEGQLKGSEEQYKANQRFNSDLAKINEALAASAQELKKYHENAVQLNQHLEALNKIYGNMLGAMNYKK